MKKSDVIKRKNDFVKYLLLVAVFIGTSMWSQISLFVSGMGQKRSPATRVENLELTQTIAAKTGVDLPYFYISDSEKVWGMMAGIPGRPTMVLSRPLYESFTMDELQFVVLHEMGHYKNQHSVKEFFVSLILLGISFNLLKKMHKTRPALITAVCLGFFFGVLAIQYGMVNERQADHYAITRMDHPSGAVEAAYRFRDAYNQPDHDDLLHRLLFRRIPYYERVENARAEIVKRMEK
jgi:Zn-dependent protease with chaperone function